MGITKHSDTEMEIIGDLRRGDEVRLTKTANGGLALVIRNPLGGINGPRMVAGTILSAAETRAVKDWL